MADTRRRVATTKKDNRLVPLSAPEIRKFIRDLAVPSTVPGTRAIGGTLVSLMMGGLTDRAAYLQIVKVIESTPHQRLKLDNDMAFKPTY
jgi:hypothetical protein